VIGGVGNDHLSGGPGDGDVFEGDYGTQPGGRDRRGRRLRHVSGIEDMVGSPFADTIVGDGEDVPEHRDRDRREQPAD
jgi:hypothetical protein